MTPKTLLILNPPPFKILENTPYVDSLCRKVGGIPCFDSSLDAEPTIISVADLGFLEGDGFGNPTRTEGVWSYNYMHL